MGYAEGPHLCSICDEWFDEDEGHRDADAGEWVCNECRPRSLSDDPDYLCELAWDRAHGLY